MFNLYTLKLKRKNESTIRILIMAIIVPNGDFFLNNQVLAFIVILIGKFMEVKIDEDSTMLLKGSCIAIII